MMISLKYPNSLQKSEIFLNQFDDYVLCKIYKNGRMKDKAVSYQLQQPRVTSNDQDESLTNDIDMDQNEQDDVVAQYTNQSMDLTALDHVNIHLPVLDSNQHMSPSIGKVMVHDQQAHVPLRAEKSKTIEYFDKVVDAKPSLGSGSKSITAQPHSSGIKNVSESVYREGGMRGLYRCV
ncbi:hypothetical protein M8C21_017976, partial [Ambrosia artemisiifolia]